MQVVDAIPTCWHERQRARHGFPSFPHRLGAASARCKRPQRPHSSPPRPSHARTRPSSAPSRGVRTRPGPSPRCCAFASVCAPVPSSYLTLVSAAQASSSTSDRQGSPRLPLPRSATALRRDLWRDRVRRCSRLGQRGADIGRGQIHDPRWRPGERKRDSDGLEPDLPLPALEARPRLETACANSSYRRCGVVRNSRRVGLLHERLSNQTGVDWMRVRVKRAATRRARPALRECERVGMKGGLWCVGWENAGGVSSMTRTKGLNLGLLCTEVSSAGGRAHWLALHAVLLRRGRG